MAKSKVKSPLVYKKPVKIQWMKSTQSLSQIYSKGLEYCFISKDNKQCFPFVYCKDFLQDAIASMHHKKPVSIYGFNFSTKTCEPLCMGSLKIALANSSDKNFANKIPQVVDFLRQFEKQLHMVRTTAKAVSNPPKRYSNGVFLIESSSKWMLSPPLISMYTLLIRVGFIHKKGHGYQTTFKRLLGGKVKPYQSNDLDQLEEAQEGIEKVLKYGYAKIFYNTPIKNYPAKVNIHDLHNSTGIVAFASGESAVFVKHWHRDLDQPNKKKTKSVKKKTQPVKKIQIS